MRFGAASVKMEMTRIMMIFSYISLLFTKIQAASEKLEESIFQCVSIPPTTTEA
jgi:hypothetical protein